MHPILFKWGEAIITSWHAFFALAAFLGWWTLTLWRRLAWPEGSPRSLDSLFLIAHISGYVGARVFSILNEGESLANLLQFGSMTLYGGILFATMNVLIFAAREKLSILRLADLTMPSLMLGIAVGRIGCFLNGDDYGKPLLDQVHIPFWAVNFPNLNDQLYRYPVQLIESLICSGLAGYCWSKGSLLTRHSGYIGTTAIFGYALTRFVLEFYRGDERGSFLTEVLSPAQLISIALIIAWACVLRYFRRV